jgi:P27 family predicted phage terminase small subunit
VVEGGGKNLGLSRYERRAQPCTFFQGFWSVYGISWSEADADKGLKTSGLLAGDNAPRRTAAHGGTSAVSWLDPLSKSLFRTLAKQLVELGILTRIDRQALARYCVLSIRWRKMEQFIQSHGEVCAIYSEPDEDGQRVLLKIDLYPQVRLASTLATELLRIENHFGLTPSARTALQVEKAPHADHDQKAKFFRQA